MEFLLFVAESSAAGEFMKNGALGAAVVALASVVVALWIDMKDMRRQRAADAETHLASVTALHNKRVEDAQAVAAQLMRTTQECVVALTNAANASEALRDTLTEIRDDLRRPASTRR